MAGFALCLRVDLRLRFRMAGVCLKTPEIEFPAGNWKGSSAMEAAFSTQPSAISQNQHQNQKPLTTEDTESTEKSGDRVIARDLAIGKANSHGGYMPMSADEPERVQQRAEALVRKIGEACDELERLAEENPELVGRVTHGAEEHKEAYLRLKARLELADAAPRCRWVRQDGTTCGSPQMKRHIYCFAHRQMAEAQALALRLPALEDANAIQVGLMRIQKALIEGTISTKTAGLLLYSMQLALQNVGRTTFGQVKAEEPVRETVDGEEALNDKQTSTTETRRHGGEEGLPLMNADDTDLEGAGMRIGPKNERDRSWVELPVSVLETETASGSFGAPSSRTGTRACSG